MKSASSKRWVGLLFTIGLLASVTTPLAAQTTDRDDLLGKRLLDLINSKPLETTAKGDRLVELLKERYNVALEGLQESYRDYKKHITEIDTVFDAARRVADSRLDMAQTPDEKLTVNKRILETLAELEEIYRGRIETLGGGESDLIRIRLARLTAEVEILRLEREIAQAAEQTPETN
jgi:hypothetical protein